MSADAPRIKLERVYDVLDQDPPQGEDWVLVDRLWPRGVKKERLAHVRWDKDVAPSDDLRRAYHHGEIDFAQFSKRYRAELDSSGAAASLLEQAEKNGAKTLVLLVSSRDADHSNGEVLEDVLEKE